MNNLLFFTAVDNGYEKFIPLYVYFANKYNENSYFEFLVKNLSKDFEDLMNNFAKEFNIKSLKLRNYNNTINADTLRWLEEPITKCEYTYIGDVDIFINENILPFHLNELKKYGTIYDNKIRLENKILMSGLQFVKTKEYYEQTNIIRKKYYEHILNNKNIYNEKVIKDIIIESNLKLLDNVKENTFNRPAHGLHISLNRKPFTNAMFFPSSEYKKMFINNLYISNDWNKLKPFLSKEIFNVLNICTNYVNSNI